MDNWHVIYVRSCVQCPDRWYDSKITWNTSITLDLRIVSSDAVICQAELQ
jgi:hypothetical protein